MSTQTERPIALREFLGVILRHKSKVLLWGGMVLGLSVLVLMVWPRAYESEAKLFVRLGRESVTLDPTATTGTTVPVQESRENQINSTRDMLRSRVLLERVVGTLGAETILKGPPEQSSTGIATLMSTVKDDFSSMSFSPPISPSEKAVEKLAKAIDVTLARNSSVIGIRCTAKTPQLAQEIMQAFLGAYQEQHMAANRTSGSLEFFTEQTAQLKRQLDKASEELRDTKNTFGLVSIPVEQQALQTQMTQIEAAAWGADSSLASAEASIVSLKGARAELPEQLKIQQTVGFPNVAADNMRQEFFKLQISSRELESKLSEHHPLVITSREQVRQLEPILNAQSVERVQTTTGLNPTRQSLETELRREETLAASLRAKASRLKEQYAELQQRTRALNDREMLISELERRVAIAEASYRSYADHLEQARIGEALEANRISNINVVQPPSLVEKPVSPRPLLVLGLGFLVAVCGGLGLALTAEYFGSSVETGPELETPFSSSALGGIFRALGSHASLNR